MTHLRGVTVGVAAGLLLAGCGHSGAGTAGGKSGKTYKPDTAGQRSTSAAKTGSNAPLPMPAETVSGKTSAASDAGRPNAAKGQAVMTPGAPVAKGKRP